MILMLQLITGAMFSAVTLKLLSLLGWSPMYYYGYFGRKSGQSVLVLRSLFIRNHSKIPIMLLRKSKL